MNENHQNQCEDGLARNGRREADMLEMELSNLLDLYHILRDIVAVIVLFIPSYVQWRKRSSIVIVL